MVLFYSFCIRLISFANQFFIYLFFILKKKDNQCEEKGLEALGKALEKNSTLTKLILFVNLFYLVN